MFNCSQYEGKETRTHCEISVLYLGVPNPVLHSLVRPELVHGAIPGSAWGLFCFQ